MASSCYACPPRYLRVLSTPSSYYKDFPEIFCRVLKFVPSVRHIPTVVNMKLESILGLAAALTAEAANLPRGHPKLEKRQSIASAFVSAMNCKLD